MSKARQAATIRKPQIDTTAALAFAEPPAAGSKAGRSRPGRTHLRAVENVKRVFFAPDGDRRLTINLRQDLHKKLKLMAVEQETTIGEILERLVEKHL